MEIRDYIKSLIVDARLCSFNNATHPEVLELRNKFTTGAVDGKKVKTSLEELRPLLSQRHIFLELLNLFIRQNVG